MAYDEVVADLKESLQAAITELGQTKDPARKERLRNKINLLKKEL